MRQRQTIGVLTFHRCINYGSYWQARCLVEGLRARGHDAVLLDHDSHAVRWAEWRCALQPRLPLANAPPDLGLYAAKIRLFLEAIEALPHSRPFTIDQPDGLPHYGTVVVGSDEVWNLRHPWYGGKALFYGDGLEGGRLVSYAASFGNQDAGDGLPPSWAGRLNRFAAISVRDDNSARLVQRSTGIEPDLVLDPCLQFPDAIPARRGETCAPYLAVYGHGFPSWFAASVRDWAKRRNYRLVSVGYRNEWADDQRLATGPQGFAELMAGAAAVATNFFHGCVFALLNARPFACVTSRYRANKVRDLMRLIGAERHLLSDAALGVAVQDVLESPVDGAVLHRIEALRRRSDAYLAAALG